jgi:hypothetical protein
MPPRPTPSGLKSPQNTPLRVLPRFLLAAPFLISCMWIFQFRHTAYEVSGCGCAFKRQGTPRAESKALDSWQAALSPNRRFVSSIVDIASDFNLDQVDGVSPAAAAGGGSGAPVRVRGTRCRKEGPSRGRMARAPYAQGASYGPHIHDLCCSYACGSAPSKSRLLVRRALRRRKENQLKPAALACVDAPPLRLSLLQISVLTLIGVIHGMGGFLLVFNHLFGGFLLVSVAHLPGQVSSRGPA